MSGWRSTKQLDRLAGRRSFYLFYMFVLYCVLAHMINMQTSLEIAYGRGDQICPRRLGTFHLFAKIVYHMGSLYYRGLLNIHVAAIQSCGSLFKHQRKEGSEKNLARNLHLPSAAYAMYFSGPRSLVSSPTNTSCVLLKERSILSLPFSCPAQRRK